MAHAIVTRDSIKTMISNPDRSYVSKVIGRALVAIYKRQTEAEQAHDATVEDNGVGFAGPDAHTGSLSAKYFMKHGQLQDWQIALWSKVAKNGYPRICKYHKQLNEIALANQRKVAQ